MCQAPEGELVLCRIWGREKLFIAVALLALGPFVTEQKKVKAL